MVAVCIAGNITHTLKAEGFDASEDGTGRGQAIVAAFQDVANTLRVPSNGAAWRGDGCDNFGHQGMAVRRLTPRECERLQGFPDDYTLIPIVGTVRKQRPKELPEKYAYYLTNRKRRYSADGPRYKALGNSMAVPCMRWIGERIQAVVDIKGVKEAA